MRRAAAALSLLCLTGTAAAQPIVEGVGGDLMGRVLGGGAGVSVMVVEAPQRGERFSAFQTFVEFGPADTDVRLVAVAPSVLATTAPSDDIADMLATTLDVLPAFDVPSAEDGRFGPALDPATLVIGEPDTLGPDVGLIALGDDEGGSLPPIALPQAAADEAPIPNPVPGAVWLLGTALVGLRLAHRRRA